VPNQRDRYWQGREVDETKTFEGTPGERKTTLKPGLERENRIMKPGRGEGLNLTFFSFGAVTNKKISGYKGRKAEGGGRSIFDPNEMASHNRR